MRQNSPPLILLLLIFISKVNSQTPDYIEYKKEKYQITISPLRFYREQFFASMSFFEFQNKVILKDKKVEQLCFACVKKFVSEWKIVNDKIYLSNIKSYNFENDSIKIKLNRLFDSPENSELVNCDWFTGKLYLHKGEYINMGMSTSYALFKTEIELSFKNGRIIKEKTSNNNYYKSDFLRNVKNRELKKLIISKLTKKQLESLKNKLVFFQIQSGKTKNDFTVMSRFKGENKNLTELNKIVKKVIPEFDYYYHNGKPIIVSRIFRITF